ncbi:hypothetical protein TRFO_12500 [Tritrichomonas foetus]|uniref:RING-type domain-containing protein n=1 Tax=Tritrichomonas foetus TaxID=1144522 RepID=A0A1J4L5P6_9EUKA|nr:hypothetical protein TRFO_12500 [Tritrichomonas foetus]|eukprot:OHT17332.1 hypothetical protein TRFO_12500 [Tritrichomonas foetus]
MIRANDILLDDPFQRAFPYEQEEKIIPGPPTSLLGELEIKRTHLANLQAENEETQKSINSYFSTISKLMFALETMAFDLDISVDWYGFFNLDNNQSKEKKIEHSLELMDHCFKLDEKDLPNLSNSKFMEKHIKFLIDSIVNNNGIIRGRPYEKIETTGKVELFLEIESKLDKFIEIENELFSNHFLIKNYEPSLEIDLDYNPEFVVNYNEFAQWILGRFEVAPPPNLKRLANRMAYRLTSVFQLQEKISKLKLISELVENTNPDELIDVNAITTSQNYKNINRLQRYIQQIVKTLNFEKTGKSIVDNKNKIKIELYNLEKYLQQNYERYQQRCNEFIRIIGQQERDFEILKQKLNQTVQHQISIFANNSLPDRNDNKYSHIIKLINEIKLHSSNPDYIKAIDQILEICKDSKIHYSNALDVAYKLRNHERAIFDNNSKRMLDEGYRNDDFRDLINNLIDRRNRYLREVAPVHETLEGILKRIRHCNSNSINLNKKIIEFFSQIKEEFIDHNEELTNNLDELSVERNDILNQLDSLNDEIAELEREVYYRCEDRAALGQSSTQRDDQPKEEVNSVFQDNLILYEQKIICPACRRNLRCILIDECGHVVCRKCFEEKRKNKIPTCPICDIDYSPNDYTILD